MIRQLLCPGLLDTGPVNDTLMAVRDGMVNFYILKAPDGLVCIDTGWRSASVAKGFEALGLNTQDVTAVLLTHLHWDHARCLSLFGRAEVFVGERETAPVLMRRSIHTQDLKRVKGDQSVSTSGLAVRVVDTPGHTLGSVSYVVDNNLLFSGDTLRLKHGKVLPFLSWLNRDGRVLNRSIHTLAEIKGIACLCTAHNGICRDTGKAFSPWRGSSDHLPQGSATP